MDFRLELEVKPFSTTIQHTDKILLAGSCFTEHIAKNLSDARFNVLTNPNGILFNPLSITNAITGYTQKKNYQKDDLFYFNESWHSWDHHSRFSYPDAETTLQEINNSHQNAHEFLKSTNWLIITLGSAFVYELADNAKDFSSAQSKAGSIVANCHKVPAAKFKKRLLSIEEVLAGLDEMIYRLSFFNPDLKIIFTISPVRHIKDGIIENNRSKAILIQSVQQLVEKFDKLFYFPAYELVLDDLRDYRFFAEDMVHPNHLAIQYVWEKFVAACINPSSYNIIQEMQKINAAMQHRPFNPSSVAHKDFLKSMLEKVNTLATELPYINFERERAYFG